MRISRLKFQTGDSIQVCVCVRVCLFTVLRLSVCTRLWGRGKCIHLSGINNPTMLIKMQTNFVHTRTHTYTHPNTPHSHRHRCCLSRRGALNLSHLKYDDKQKRTQSRIQTKRNEIKLHFYLQMLCTSAQRECDANE